MSEAEGTLAVLQNEPLREPDLNDRASSETDWSIELRTRDRQRKLISTRSLSVSASSRVCLAAGSNGAIWAMPLTSAMSSSRDTAVQSTA